MTGCAIWTRSIQSAGYSVLFAFLNAHFLTIQHTFVLWWIAFHLFTYFNFVCFRHDRSHRHYIFALFEFFDCSFHRLHSLDGHSALRILDSDVVLCCWSCISLSLDRLCWFRTTSSLSFGCMRFGVVPHCSASHHLHSEAERAVTSPHSIHSWVVAILVKQLAFRNIHKSRWITIH